MTFSIVGRSPDGAALGVAVASKFLAAGAYVPAAASDAGAVATQAHVNLLLKTRGLELMRAGTPAAELLDGFFADDPRRGERQAGVVDRSGAAATFTGAGCQAWAGGRSGEGPEGSFAAQGNMLVGPEVVDEMVASWLSTAGGPALAHRLVAALAAGQAVGGDPRGKQAAAVLVVSPGAGYGGLGDVVVDLRSDDAAEPIGDLERMLDLHDLYFGSTPEEQLLPWDDALRAEVAARLATTGYASGTSSATCTAGWGGRTSRSAGTSTGSTRWCWGTCGRPPPAEGPQAMTVSAVRHAASIPARPHSRSTADSAINR